MIAFLSANARWLAAGMLLTFVSSFGQTWFIALFAGEIRAVHGLSDGAWGLIYTVATLSAAALLFARGALADTMPLPRLALIVMAIFAVSALAVGLTGWLLVLLLGLTGLRFAGQGMSGHIAMVAMGRWFRARRGRAVSIAGLGFSMGEGVLPVVTIALVAAIGWRAGWVAVAAAILGVVLPLLLWLLARERRPEGPAPGEPMSEGIGGRDWDRQAVLRHWLFWALLPILLTPGFVGTVVFFHQVHVAEVKGWSLAQMAPGFPVYALMNVAAALMAGGAADRFGPHRLLPVLLVPMALGCALIGPAGSPLIWILALGCLGMTQGAYSATWGALLPSVYGTAHLGAVRALVTTLTVVSTAIGPVVTGVAIDLGVPFPAQAILLTLWGLIASGLGLLIVRRLERERAGERRQPNTV